ncbi:ornithine carbamoyltransferase [Chryseolinea serpens]|uniref:Ornithine carbamoyltransferase n=1 Tax=Chryseolinea serpens TaxID=947013 RepID=A0A1M5VA38_9BACT|nr:ornithine carbamoyltransferase [Chryseolinea serpens]SHH72095.1 ornithine carbamoyltransferase [Chryseolinea serpens]
MKTNTPRHLISLRNIADEDIRVMVSRGLAFSNRQATPDGLLKNKVIGIYFRKTSTRTRTAFSSAALRMGAQIISFGPNDLQENTGESINDTTLVLSRMLDGFVARTAGAPAEMEAFAAQNRMAVINAMSMDEHPTQALADLTTIVQHFNSLSGIRVLYVGEGNNTASALALALPRFAKTSLYLYTPQGYGVPEEAMASARQTARRTGATVSEHHDTSKLPEEVEVIYTTRWQTTGTSKPDPKWRDAFSPFTVSQKLMDKYPNAIFMHDLPAHRGEEVESAVIDGSKSIAFDQAENKFHSATAVLEWCLNSQ